MASSGPQFAASTLGSDPRLGRALFYVHQQLLHATEPVVRSKLGGLILAGEAMDFAVRLKGSGAFLTPAVAVQFAAQAGIGEYQLYNTILPKLKEADLVDYGVDLAGGGLSNIQEFVGLTGRVVDQAMRVADLIGMSPVELAVLHSTEIASWAPLTASQHLEQLVQRGFDDAVAEESMTLTVACGVNQQVWSSQLNENVIFNPHVWGAESASIAGFLATLPSSERDSLLGMCEQAAVKPGLVLSSYQGFSGDVVNSARKVGLLQSATVRSSMAGSSPQTYVFSPLMETDDDKLVTSESLHQRKLFLAHILYGHERSSVARGRIFDPRILVDRLLTRGKVGPATAIAQDYHLLEGYGIVAVRDAGGGQAYLEAVKHDIIEGGLGWLRQSFGESNGVAAGAGDLMPPSSWVTPAQERSGVQSSAAADEITTAAIMRLREARAEAQRVARHDF